MTNLSGNIFYTSKISVNKIIILIVNIVISLNLIGCLYKKNTKLQLEDDKSFFQEEKNTTLSNKIIEKNNRQYHKLEKQRIEQVKKKQKKQQRQTQIQELLKNKYTEKYQKQDLVYKEQLGYFKQGYLIDDDNYIYPARVKKKITTYNHRLSKTEQQNILYKMNLIREFFTYPSIKWNQNGEKNILDAVYKMTQSCFSNTDYENDFLRQTEKQNNTKIAIWKLNDTKVNQLFYDMEQFYMNKTNLRDTYAQCFHDETCYNFNALTWSEAKSIYCVRASCFLPTHKHHSSRKKTVKWLSAKKIQSQNLTEKNHNKDRIKYKSNKEKNYFLMCQYYSK